MKKSPRLSRVQLCSQKHPSIEFFMIQSMYRVILVYTPGYPRRAHPLPHDTTPMSSYFLSSRAVIKGPPLSPCKRFVSLHNPRPQLSSTYRNVISYFEHIYIAFSPRASICVLKCRNGEKKKTSSKIVKLNEINNQNILVRMESSFHTNSKIQYFARHLLMIKNFFLTF